MLSSPLEENVDSEEGLAKDPLIYTKERLQKVAKRKGQLEMCGRARQGSRFSCVQRT